MKIIIIMVLVEKNSRITLQHTLSKSSFDDLCKSQLFEQNLKLNFNQNVTPANEYLSKTGKKL